MHYQFVYLNIHYVCHRSVEINNTDAEGRVILAEGVVYASRDLNASIILDMATLTYAQVDPITILALLYKLLILFLGDK